MIFILTMSAFIGTSIYFAPAQQDARRIKSQWLPASSHLWTGVVVYIGKEPQSAIPSFVAVGGNRNHFDAKSGQTYNGVKVMHESGTYGWVNRDIMGRSGVYWVKADDPAIQKQDWKTFTD